MQIRPQDATVHMLGSLEQVMVIVPIDPNKHKTQEVTDKDWNERAEGRQVHALRHMQFEHHNGNDNGYHSITKCFESSLVHFRFSLTARRASARRNRRLVPNPLAR